MAGQGSAPTLAFLEQRSKLVGGQVDRTKNRAERAAVEFRVQGDRHRGTTSAREPYVTSLLSDFLVSEFTQGGDALPPRNDGERRHESGCDGHLDDFASRPLARLEA